MPERTQSVLPLQVSDLKFDHNKRSLLSIDRLVVEQNTFLCIVGPNGAGKSLLLKTMAGLQGGEGQVLWGASAPSRKGYNKLGMLLQTPVLLRRSVSANIDFALKSQTTLDKSQRKQAVVEALALAKMEHLSQSSARLLSGGERQRLALARALACRPELLLLDEPAASMDPASTAWLESTLLDAHHAGLTVVMVTHDLNQAKRLASRVVLLHRGRVVEDAAKQDFFTHPTSPEARAFVGGELLF